MNSILLDNIRKNEIYIIEVLRTRLFDIYIKQKNTSSLTVLELAEKLKKEGRFYFLFINKHQFIINVKDNKIIDIVKTTNLIPNKDTFTKVKVRHFEYRRFNNLDTNTLTQLHRIIYTNEYLSSFLKGI